MGTKKKKNSQSYIYQPAYTYRHRHSHIASFVSFNNIFYILIALLITMVFFFRIFKTSRTVYV